MVTLPRQKVQEVHLNVGFVLSTILIQETKGQFIYQGRYLVKMTL